MTVVLAILYAILGLALLVLLVPVRARASGSVHDGVPDGEIRADWGLGLVSVELDARGRTAVRLLRIPVARFTLRTAADRRGRGARARPRREAKRRKRKAGALARFRALLAERDALPGMAARLGRALHLRIRASGRVGTGDPADTAALAVALAALPRADLAVEVDWVDESFELDVEVAATIWIAELLVIAALALLARRQRRALRAAFGALRT